MVAPAPPSNSRPVNRNLVPRCHGATLPHFETVARPAWFETIGAGRRA
jgi:hypothetical protein